MEQAFFQAYIIPYLDDILLATSKKERTTIHISHDQEMLYKKWDYFYTWKSIKVNTVKYLRQLVTRTAVKPHTHNTRQSHTHTLTCINTHVHTHKCPLEKTLETASNSQKLLLGGINCLHPTLGIPNPSIEKERRRGSIGRSFHVLLRDKGRTTDTWIQTIEELAHINIHQIYGLLEHVKGTNL